MLGPGWMERSRLFRRRTFLQASAGWLGTHCLGLEQAGTSTMEAKTTQSGTGFIRLFNGKDLTG
ncbi:MAG TPA: hypothetical protein VFJ27_09720, partial [Terriglobia bacterium]|nr:hypothetical protein [Terriglobia bacterium]